MSKRYNMQPQTNILDIASELADVTTFKGNPESILFRLKEKFNLNIDRGAEVKQLNEALSQHTYHMSRSSFSLNVRFLFHALSGRWYVDHVG